MIDPSLEGSVSPSVCVRVEPDALSRALDTAPGEVPAILPAVWWSQVPQPWIAAGQLPILREQRVELFRPLLPGEELICTITLQRVRTRGDRQHLTCALEARAGQELVASAVSLLVVLA